MTQNTTKRPRVAAIGLDKSQIESIAPLCGTLRSADLLEEYLKNYNPTETDITILGNHSFLDLVDPVDVGGNVITIDCWKVNWIGHGSSHRSSHRSSWHLWTQNNTEREVRVSKACPERYKHLAAELARQLGCAEDPPPVFTMNFPKDHILVETTSGWPVALRCVSTNNTKASEGEKAIVIALPRGVRLLAWFRAFLADIHELDRARVPQKPPRLGNPSNWHTPEESALAKRIAEISDEVEQLKAEQERIQVELADASEKTEVGIRRCIWADGDDLVAAVGNILEELGFVVRHMDAGQQQGKPKREDLRLTLADRPEWEAIAEVKGYTKSTRTNDSRQIREQRERYIGEKKSPPDLTLWIVNTHRAMDPSSRPAPDSNVGEAADNIGAVHVLTTDLYRLWALVAAGSLKKAQAVQQLIDAAPGLWSPPALNADRHNSH